MAKHDIDFIDFRVTIQDSLTEEQLADLVSHVKASMEGLDISAPYICTQDGERIELG